MKAIVVTHFGGPEHMKVIEMEPPKINSKQVLIRVKYTSVNYADIKSRYGKKRGTLPFIPGLDVAGIVESVGSEVTKLKAGQRVIAFPKNGSYAEYVVADEILTYSIPDSIDFQTAAACPIVSFLSFKLIEDIARLQKHETILIHAAAGGVGTTAIQIAKILGAGTVIGTVGSEQKKEIALEAGADHVICYENENFAQKVNELTNGEGVNIILDSIAGRVTEDGLNCLAPFGRLVMFGNSSGLAANISTNDLHSSCRSILGYSLGTTRNKRPELLQGVADKVFTYIQNGSLHIKIGRQFDLLEVSDAHIWIESRQSIGKVILKVE